MPHIYMPWLNTISHHRLFPPTPEDSEGREAQSRDVWIDHARKLIDKGEAHQYMADLLNVGRSTLYRPLAE